MNTTLDNLKLWMDAKENEHLEFKAAERNYSTDTLTNYCCAFANEGGGHMILGVTDKKPRIIVGSNAFLNLQEIKSKLISRLHIRIEVDELLTENGRVLVFSIPSRPIGVPIQYNGVYWMRRGEELVAMIPDMLKSIFNEGEPDFTAQICPQASLLDLDITAISIFRDLWFRKSGNSGIKQMNDEKLLNAIEVIGEKGITYAALILFGTKQALGKYLAQDEVIFEYRSSEVTGPAQQRIEYREGFFLFYNDLWEKINLRNDTQHFQDGLFIWDIPTFNEKAIRESILNAVSHRDYRMAGSVWVKQYPRSITIASPGGFPTGITPENILWKQQPRNRRLAEVFAKCGLVERAGQGADAIFEESIKQGKPLPNFSRTDEHEVVITLNGQVQDENFLRFLEKIGQETLASFSTEDFLILDYIHKDLPIPSSLSEFKGRLKTLVDIGVVERIGHGRGAKYLLSRKFYKHLGQSGIYTRIRGLNKRTNKELLLQHIRENANTGSNLAELCQVLPALSKSQIQKLNRELKESSLIEIRGKGKASHWFPTSYNLKDHDSA